MEPSVAKEIAKLDYVAIKNLAPFDIGCMPEDRGDPEKLKRHIMINSTSFFIPAGEFFIDKVGIAQKLRNRGQTTVIRASEKEIKECSLIKSHTYVYEKEEMQPDGTVKKSGAIIGFTHPLQVLAPATEEYYLASKHVGGGVASAKRIAKLEAEAQEALKLKSELEKAAKEREAMMKEREGMLQQIAELKAKTAVAGFKKG